MGHNKVQCVSSAGRERDEGTVRLFSCGADDARFSKYFPYHYIRKWRVIRGKGKPISMRNAVVEVEL